MAWTVYRDVAYDLGPFFATHPGGKCVPRRAAPRSRCFGPNHSVRPRAADSRPASLPPPALPRSWLLRLAVGRDSTALVESYHLRPETVDARFKRLPKLPDYPVQAVPRSPRPNDSELYNAIRDRVRNEVSAPPPSQ